MLVLKQAEEEHTFIDPTGEYALGGMGDKMNIISFENLFFANNKTLELCCYYIKNNKVIAIAVKNYLPKNQEEINSLKVNVPHFILEHDGPIQLVVSIQNKVDYCWTSNLINCFVRNSPTYYDEDITIKFSNNS